MSGNIPKTTSLVLTLFLVIAVDAFAGENGLATFRLTSKGEMSNVGPGEEVQVQIGAAGLVGVKEIEVFFKVSPANAFDLGATAFEFSTAWLAPNPVAVVDASTAPLVRAALTTAAAFNGGSEATITVERIAVGSSSVDLDVFDGSELDLSATIRPGPTAVLESTETPLATQLEQNYPNPFNAVTNIHFSLAGPANVTLTVYDITGQTVRKLIAKQLLQAGTYRQSWDGRNQAGETVASGLYFYDLRAGTFTSIKKMTLLK